MQGVVTGEDPRQRSGDLELKLENPLGFSKVSVWWRPTRPYLKFWLQLGSASASPCMLGEASPFEALQPH